MKALGKEYTSFSKSSQTSLPLFIVLKLNKTANSRLNPRYLPSPMPISKPANFQNLNDLGNISTSWHTNRAKLLAQIRRIRNGTLF